MSDSNFSGVARVWNADARRREPPLIVRSSGVGCRGVVVKEKVLPGIEWLGLITTMDATQEETYVRMMSRDIAAYREWTGHRFCDERRG